MPLTKCPVSEVECNKHHVSLHQEIWTKQDIVPHATVPTTGINPYHNSFTRFFVQNRSINIQIETILVTDYSLFDHAIEWASRTMRGCIVHVFPWFSWFWYLKIIKILLIKKLNFNISSHFVVSCVIILIIRRIVRRILIYHKIHIKIVLKLIKNIYTYLKLVRADIRFRIGDALKTVIQLVVKNCFGFQTLQQTLRNLQLYILLGTNPNNRKSIKQELGQPHFKLRLLHITWFYIYI